MQIRTLKLEVMANTRIVYKELRVVLEPELTQVYVFLVALNDAPLGLEGWHHKTFPASKSVVDILNSFGGEDSPLMWPQKAPER